MVRTPWSNNPSTPWGPVFVDPNAPQDGTSEIDPLALFYATFFGTPPSTKGKVKPSPTPAPATVPVGTTREEMLTAQFAARDREYARQRLESERAERERIRNRQRGNYVERPPQAPGNSFFPSYVGPPPPEAPTIQPWTG